MPEFRDLSTDATAEGAAEKFAKIWAGRIEWVRRPTLFRLGRTLYRVRQRGLAWEVSEDARQEEYQLCTPRQP
jgi:hypothetical protein